MAFFRRGFLGACAITAHQSFMFKTAKCDTKPRKSNLILGDQSLAESERKHRVGLASWSHCAMKDALKMKTLGDLFDHCKEVGYDGLETGINDLRDGGYFDDSVTNTQAIEMIRKETERTGVQILGALYIITDGNPPYRHFDLDFEEIFFEEKLRSQIRADKKAGAEYITFQICLPPKYMNTGGAYRDDQKFISLCAERIAKLQRICFEEELNFYVETHVDRISEDLAGFVKILENARCPDTVEVNGDLSHYIYRGWTKGKHLEKILARLGHTHQRMARTHGDLSSSVQDLKADWNKASDSLTKSAWEMIAGVLASKKGLSSRAIVAESGPIHLVENSLAENDRLVPFFKFMKCFADQECEEREADSFF